MRLQSSRCMVSSWRCQALPSAVSSRQSPSQRTGRVWVASACPTTTGHALASHAKVASGRPSRRTTDPRNSPARSMRLRILAQRGCGNARACAENCKTLLHNFPMRSGTSGSGMRSIRRYRLRVRTWPSQGRNQRCAGPRPQRSTRHQRSCARTLANPPDSPIRGTRPVIFGARRRRVTRLSCRRARSHHWNDATAWGKSS
jgi:hypothetical protein